MAKSEFAVEMDGVQRAIRPCLTAQGFRARGRTFNRQTPDGLTHVIGFQMGRHDPPGTLHIPWFRENKHGQFTVNLGVYVPEVQALWTRLGAKTWVQEYDCHVRSRLAAAAGHQQDTWWTTHPISESAAEVQQMLLKFGLPFLQRFASRDQILVEWRDQTENLTGGTPPRIVRAVILASRGELKRARELLTDQIIAVAHPGHAELVRGLAERLSIGVLNV